MTTIDVHNPADGRLVATVPEVGAAEVEAMAKRLRDAQPAWEALGPDGRAVHLWNWLNWFLDNERPLGIIVQQETGKSWADASLEPLVAVDIINYYAKHAREFLSPRQVKPHSLAQMSKKLSVVYRPYQLVGLISPWNGPIANPILDVIGALAAGASVLSKPSEVTPLSWAECVRGWNEDIAAPPVLGNVIGAAATGAAVVDVVDMVMFTGSARTGRKIAARCGERLIPCSLELGGKDAMVVLSDADLDRAAAGAAWGGMVNGGQGCVSVERVYVEAPVYDDFVARVTDEVRKIRVGSDGPGEFSCEYGAMITSDQLRIVERHVSDAVAKGGRILTGGRTIDGRFFEPTVLVDVDHTMACMREETFGPTLPIMKVIDEEEAIGLANDSEYGLSASVWSREPARAERIGRRIEAGAVNLNSVLANLLQLGVPMGGWKDSGLGARFGGANGVLKYCRAQTIVADRISLKSEPYWFPVGPTKGKLLARAIRLVHARGWKRRLGF